MKKFEQIPVDEQIIVHTSNPEYEKLKHDKTMDAFRDRSTKIELPILEKDVEENANY